MWCKVKCRDHPSPQLNNYAAFLTSLSSDHLPSGNRHKPVLQPPVQLRRSPAGRRSTVDEREEIKRGMLRTVVTDLRKLLTLVTAQ